MPEFPGDWIVPEWPVCDHAGALITTRTGGTSPPPFASLNLGFRVQDDRGAVSRNREIVRRFLPSEPRWLNQVHGTHVVQADHITGDVDADASFSRVPGTVCTVMIADCLPVLLADRSGQVVAAAHAGWRGLAAGVIERTLEAMEVAPGNLVAFLGPAIGPDWFEVGPEVREAFVLQDPNAEAAFVPLAGGKWLADLFRLARQRLARAGVTTICGGGLCTASDPARFFSHRRDRVSGRMAAFIWLRNQATDPVRPIY